MKKIYLFTISILISQFIGFAQTHLSPIPECEKKVFLITDFAYTRALNSVYIDTRLKRGNINNYELGMMANLSSGFALGSTVHLAFANSDPDPEFYIKIRMRKWLSKKISIDLAPGFEVSSKKLMVSLDVHFTDWFAITTQIEPEQTYNGLKYPISAGIKFSSRDGLAIQVLAFLVTIVEIATWDGFSF